MREYLLTLLGLFLSISLLAATPVPPKVLKVANGANYVDITGDGTPGLIVSGHRENFNAHSFEVVSFYVLINTTSGKKQWNIIPIVEQKTQNSKEDFEVTVGGGADCLLHDFRLIAKRGNEPPTLIIAQRKTGDYVSKEKVTFSYYPLVHPTETYPGIIPYSFELSHTTETDTKYCDVGQAFEEELGLSKP